MFNQKNAKKLATGLLLVGQFAGPASAVLAVDNEVSQDTIASEVESVPLESELPSIQSFNEEVETFSENVKAPKIVTTFSQDMMSNMSDLVVVNCRVSYQYSLANFNDGKVIIQLPDGLLMDFYVPSSELNSVKNVTYDSVARTLTYELNDTIVSGADFVINYKIKPSGTITSGEHTIQTTVKGKSNGEEELEVQNEASINYIGETVDVAGINDWKFSGSNVSLIPGNWVNVGSELSCQKISNFNNLRIRYKIQDTTINIGGLSEVEIFNCFNVLRTTTIDGRKVTATETNVSATEFWLDFGPVNGSITPKVKLIGDTAKLNAKAVTGDKLVVKAEIYNNDTLVTESTRAITAKADVETELDVALSADSVVWEKGIFNLNSKFSGLISQSKVSEASYIMNIPSGLSLIQATPYTDAGDGSNNQKLEYRLRGTDEFIALSGTKPYPSLKSIIYDLSTLGDIDALRVTSKSEGTGGIMVTAKNDSYAVGEKIVFSSSEATYVDNATNEVKKPENQAKEITVGTKPAETTVQVYDNPLQNSVNAGDFDVNVKLKGDTWEKTTRFGVQGGELDNPYMFVIVPKGLKVSLLANNIGTYYKAGNSISYYWAFGGHLLPLEPYSLNTEDPIELSDGRLMYKFTVPEGTGISYHNYLTMLHLNLRYTIVNVEAGEYEVETGMGSMTQNDLVDASMSAGFSKETLSSELKQSLGAKTNNYFSKKQTLAVHTTSDISTSIKVKGSADSNWLDGSSVATTIPGQAVDYQIDITNSGTIGIRNFQLITTLPYVGDTLLTNSSIERGSEFNGTTTNGDFKVYLNDEETDAIRLTFSESSDPLRFDLDGNQIGDVDSVWQSTNSSKTLAIKLDVNSSVSIKPGDKVKITYSNTIPADAPRDGKVAVSTFAYMGRTSTGEIVAAETSTVKVRTTAPATDLEIGGKIFSDLDENGQQDTNESGLNQVQLSLFKYNPTSKKYEDTKYNVSTNTNSASEAGYFNFSGLKEGKYKIKITLPANTRFNKNGDYVEVIDEQTAWIKYNNNTELAINTLGTDPVRIQDIAVPLYHYTEVMGKIVFVKQEPLGEEISSTYGKNFNVTLKDMQGKKIATTTADTQGNYSFENLEIPATGNYQLYFEKPQGSTLAYFEDQTQAVQLIRGGLTTKDFKITDTDKPEGSISFTDTEGQTVVGNPAKATINITDPTTAATATWSIVNEQGQKIASGQQNEITTQLAYLKNDGRDGKYQLIATLTDTAGNTATVSGDFKILTNLPTLTVEESTARFFIGDEVTQADYLATYGISAVDALGEALPAAKITIDDSNVDYTRSGPYTATVTATDDAGNEVQATITVIIKHNATDVQVKNSAIYVGDAWTASDNFLSAADADNQPIGFDQVTVTGTVDTTKPGVYEVDYTYNGKTVTAQITVKNDQESLQVKHTTLYVGDTWTASDNFVQAKNRDGEAVAFSEVTVEGAANTATVGEYFIKYSYGKQSEVAKVTVTDNHETLLVQDSQIYVGDTWNAADNFTSATDRDGQEVTLDQVTVEGTVDTQNAGTYEITYKYGDQSVVVKVKVVPNQTAIQVHDSQIYSGTSWNAADNFDYAFDRDGNALTFDKISVTGNVDVNKVGEYQVTYSYEKVTVTATVKVVKNQETLVVKNSTICIGDTWQPSDNFISATDQAGNQIDFDKIEVEGTVNNAAVGTYTITYSYGAQQFEAIVSVIEPKTEIIAHDSTIYAGDTWRAQDNFTSAVDRFGNPVAFEEIEVDEAVVADQVGTYDVSYTYQGVTKTIQVTVVENQATLVLQDLEIYTTDEWQLEQHFIQATNKAGEAIALEELTITHTAEPTQAGSYEISFAHEHAQATATLFVKEDKTSLTIKDTTIALGSSWKAEDNFISATDRNGHGVDFSVITVEGSVDTKKVGTYEVTYVLKAPEQAVFSLFSTEETELSLSGELKAVAHVVVADTAEAPAASDQTEQPAGQQGGVTSTQATTTRADQKTYPKTGSTEQKGWLWAGIALILVAVAGLVGFFLKKKKTDEK